MRIKQFTISLFVMTLLISGEVRPLVMRPFDSLDESYTYNRGSYLILLPEGLNEIFLTNENYGGDFVKFKRSQGFDVVVQAVSSSLTAQQIKDTIIMPFYESSSGMLEYVLLVGDVNGSLAIPTFTIDSYNEEDIDVTDYPYTFTDDQYNPKFFLGRWPIRTTADFLNIKSRSIQYVIMENLSDYSYLDNSMLVAGNYKTAEGEEVPPSQWPVTPVWTSLWLMEELQDYGYTQIDTAFFHAGNWETGEYNPTIPNTWNSGVGVINYRGWGDANGWHKPYFHKEDLEGLNNGWNLPIVMSFVCNTGDFGNDYSGTGLSKCFGEVMVTAGTVINPKGAAAMVGPSDLDTDTRFNNVICGLMWSSLLDGSAPELAQALHVGKQGLIYEFSGLEAPDGTVIDAFYHHVYSVIGDPSIPVRLLEPDDISADLTDNADLTASYVSVNLTDEDGNYLPGVVGALLDENNELVGKSVSNSLGQLIIDFDTNTTSDLTLYLNSAQYRQKIIPLNYVSDDDSSYTGLIPLNVTFNHSLDNATYLDLTLVNNRLMLDINTDSQLDLEMEISSTSSDVILSGCSEIAINIPDTYSSCTIDVLDDVDVGTKIPMLVSSASSGYEIEDYAFDLIVGSSGIDYYDDDPSPECNYGYKAYDHTDTEYEQHPIYNWIEINEIGTNLNLVDDTHIDDIQIGFDFQYFGQTYNSMTVCSNGWTSFEPCSIDHFWNFSIPNPMGPSAMLAPFMDDLDDDDGNEVFNVYSYNDANGRFIIEWDNVSNGEDDQNCPDCIKETFQMILYDPEVYQTTTGDGDIIFQYKEIHDIDQNGNYSTIGIESPDQNDGVQYLFSNQPSLGSYWEENTDGYHENLAIKFTTSGVTVEDECVAFDVTGDGIVDVIDIISVVNIVLGSQTVADCSADVNFDGIVDVIDIIALVNYILA